VNASTPETFADLGLHPELLAALTGLGYEEPTPIQREAIPLLLQGSDLIGQAATGTGKTAAFALPILQRLAPQASASASPARHPVRALVITPTRELAIQVEQSFKEYGKHLPLRSTVVYGGADMDAQIRELRRGVEVLVATPGRLLDHVQSKTVMLNQVGILTLDEADRMLDMGFLPDIRRIIALLPKERQNLLFSATFSEEIKDLADSLLNAPALIEVARRNSTVEIITQTVHPVDRDRKRELLSHLIRTQNWFQVLVFTRTKHGANRLAEQLEREGIEADAIHGNKSQGARTRALRRFKDQELRVLVATDIAARGLDIESLPHVVNYDLPHVAEDYVHRIGRTGRAGLTGEAISLVAPPDMEALAAIERLIKKKIDRVLVDAPCSGFGTLRRNPDLKWRHAATAVTELGEKQGRILAAAARLVKPGGRLVYATCSILGQENEDVVDRFLRENPGFSALSCSALLAAQRIALDTGAQLRLWPHLHDTDGFFAAAFARG